MEQSGWSLAEEWDVARWHSGGLHPRRFPLLV